MVNDGISQPCGWRASGGVSATVRAAFQGLEAGFFRKLCQLALPISAQLILTSALALVDVLMVSAQGASGVAAVGLAGKFFFVIILMIAGLANGASVLAAQYAGSGDHGGVRRVLAIALLTAWVLTAPVTLACWLAPEAVMRLYASDPELIATGAGFLRITAPFHMLMATVSVLAAVLRAHGKSMLPMLVGILAVACNTIGNYFLINGNWGAPAMGVNGAALATLCSKTLECLVLLGVVWYSQANLRLSPREFVRSLQPLEVRRYLRQSLPLAANEGIWALGMFAFTLVYAHMGTVELASITLLGPIESISIEIFLGFSSATTILISTSLGARQFKRAQHLAWVMTIMITLSAALFGVVMLALREPVLYLYSGAEAKVLALARDVFLVLAATLWLRMYNCVTCVAILRSGGDVKFTLYVDLLVVWGVVLPLTAAAGLLWHWPLQWVFGLALGAEALLKAPIYTWRVLSLVWLKSLVPEQKNDAPVLVAAA